MNKPRILALIIKKLHEELDSRRKVSQRTREQGNDPESQAKSKYDTLAIEENYLADGLARMALASAQAIEALEGLHLRAFENNEPINQGALIELEFPGAKEWFFLAPAGGGTEVSHGGVTITVITPESPLGAQLMGAVTGDLTLSPPAKILQVR